MVSIRVDRSAVTSHTILEEKGATTWQKDQDLGEKGRGSCTHMDCSLPNTLPTIFEKTPLSPPEEEEEDLGVWDELVVAGWGWGLSLEDEEGEGEGAGEGASFLGVSADVGVGSAAEEDSLSLQSSSPEGTSVEVGSA